MCSKRPWMTALAFLSVLLFVSSVRAQQAEIVKVPMSAAQARMVDGQNTYMGLCATCHGTLGKGNGPVASALRAKMPDLTQLAKRNGGKFPAGEVRGSLTGDFGSIAAHGTADMPVWGAVFRSAQGEASAMLRMYNLVTYLESIQE